MDATVKWFNGEKGFGFVELSDGSGDAFLHIRAVEAAGHSDLQPGTRLVVRTAQGQKGPQVTEITEVDTSTAQAAAVAAAAMVAAAAVVAAVMAAGAAASARTARLPAPPWR